MPKLLTCRQQTKRGPKASQVAGFISEWWPASNRNGGRNEIGIPGRLASEFALSPLAVTISGGIQEIDGGNFSWSVPKRNLVSALQIALQTGQLKIARGLAESETLVRELMAFKVRISAGGHDSYSNDWREAPHDDLVLSAALACWYAARAYDGPRQFRHNLMDR